MHCATKIFVTDFRNNLPIEIILNGNTYCLV